MYIFGCDVAHVDKRANRAVFHRVHNQDAVVDCQIFLYCHVAVSYNQSLRIQRHRRELHHTYEYIYNFLLSEVADECLHSRIIIRDFSVCLYHI